MTKASLIVRNGTVVTAESVFRADVAIDGGVFTEIAAPGELSSTTGEEYDAEGKYLLPGVVDGHVHFREPGLEYKEDWETGSRAAVYGGVTTVIDMPNTLPTTSTVENAREKQSLAESKSYCDFALFGLIVQDNVDQIVPMAVQRLVVGYKVFLGLTIGNLPRPDDGMLIDALREATKVGLRVGFHAENNEIMQHRIRLLQESGRSDPLAHLDSRPVIAELESIQRMSLFAKEAGAKIHIFHLSSGPGLQMIDEWRAKGVDITTETGAHYVFLNSDDMSRLGAMMRMNPPVREPGHDAVLLQGLVDGRINGIATDHSPHPREEKLDDDIWKALSGFAGVETSVRMFLTHAVNTGRMTLPQFARATSVGPAKTWGLFPRKGAIQIGSDGDLTVIDLNQEGVIEEEALHGKNNAGPFIGQRTKGAPVSTIVRGRLVVRDGVLDAAARGTGRLVGPIVTGK
jgi:dihydroorotase